MNDTKEYPPLTDEMLIALEKKVNLMLTTSEDCELIEHYMASIGKPGVLLEAFREEGVFSFEDAEDIIETGRDEDYEDDYKFRPDGLAGSLLGCIHILQRRLKRGEKIH
jgi:hypothetical protein